MINVNIGKGITLPVDVDTMPENALNHLIYIGARNVLMDSHAGVATTEPDYQEKAKAIAEKKLAALMAGEVRVASTREGDPVKAEAIRIATGMIKTALRKKGKKAEAKAIREAAIALVARDKTITERAAAHVAEVRAADVDVSELV